MVKNALGLIETVGLAAGLEAADAAVKAANVELIGYELTKGGGMVVIKLCGDVGAVKAAVDAAAAAAGKINKVYATHVIPRPHQELGDIVLTAETVGYELVKPSKQPASTVMLPEQPGPVPEAGPAASNDAKEEQDDKKIAPIAASAEACNLCGDSACLRKKGDPRVNCLHYNDNKEDE